MGSYNLGNVTVKSFNGAKLKIENENCVIIGNVDSYKS